MFSALLIVATPKPFPQHESRSKIVIISLTTENWLQCNIFWWNNEPAPKLEERLVFISEIASFRTEFYCSYYRILLSYQTEQSLAMISYAALSLGRLLLRHHQLQGHFPSMNCFKFFALAFIHASFDSQFPHLNPAKLCKLDNSTVLLLPTFLKIITHT